MKKRKKLYGVLDSFGEVLKWTRDRPSDSYKYIVRFVNVENKLEFVEDALF